MKIVNLTSGAEVGNKIQAAFSFCSRLRGLLGRKSLLEGEGLLLHPCSSIHCFGMRFAIDAVFLDESFRIIDIRESLKSGAWASCRGACYVLELPVGLVQAKKIQCGDGLSISDVHMDSTNKIPGE